MHTVQFLILFFTFIHSDFQAPFLLIRARKFRSYLTEEQASYSISVNGCSLIIKRISLPAFLYNPTLYGMKPDPKMPKAIMFDTPTQIRWKGFGIFVVGTVCLLVKTNSCDFFQVEHICEIL